MPIPGLTDIYQFSDWAKKRGIKKGERVTIVGELGGTITVRLHEAVDHSPGGKPVDGE